MDLAYAWLCTRRKDCHSNDDVWHLRFHWKREKPRLLQALCDGTFRFDCVDEIRAAESCVVLSCLTRMALI